MIARNDSLFLRMVETARLIIDQCLSLFSGLKTTIKSWKHIDPDGHMAGRARDEVRSVIIPGQNRGMATCTGYFFHQLILFGPPSAVMTCGLRICFGTACLVPRQNQKLGSNHSRIADAVVESPSLFIKSHEDVTDIQDDGTEKLSKEPAAGPCIADLFAVRSHDL